MCSTRADNSAAVPRHRRGLVLVMVLLVLALAGAALAAAASRNCRQIEEAASDSQQLQVKWGSMSCQAFCLARAEQFVLDEPPAGGQPAIFARRQISLGNIDFDLVAFDEQAKANANQLAAAEGDAGLTEALRALQADLRDVLPAIPRRGAPTPGIISRLPQVYNSFDQIFMFDHPSRLIRPDSPQGSPVRRITCWGSGQVNIRRTEPAVMSQILAGVLTEQQLAKLINYRVEHPDLTVAEAAKHLDLAKEPAAKFNRLAVDVSRCHSVWVIANTGTRKWYLLAIDQSAGAEDDARKKTFQW